MSKLKKERKYKASRKVLSDLMNMSGESIWQLSIKTGVSKDMLWLFMRGERELGLASMLAIARHYKVSLDTFFPEFVHDIKS